MGKFLVFTQKVCKHAGSFIGGFNGKTGNNFYRTMGGYTVQ